MHVSLWPARKIWKPTLIISIVVAMASFLIACGDTSNQDQTISGNTPNQGQTTAQSVLINDAMSIIAQQRQQSYTAVEQIYRLEQKKAFQGCRADYYRNAKDYYTHYVLSNFNSWLERFANEVQNGGSLYSPNDQTLVSNAVKANDAFIVWESQVDNYFTTHSCSQGQGQGGYLIVAFPKGVPIEKPNLSEIDPEKVISIIKQFSDAMGNLRSSLSQSTPVPGGISPLHTPSLSDVLGAQAQVQARVIRGNEWQDFCVVVQNSSC